VDAVVPTDFGGGSDSFQDRIRAAPSGVCVSAGAVERDFRDMPRRCQVVVVVARSPGVFRCATFGQGAASRFPDRDG
jgi:hypothetical protein